MKVIYYKGFMHILPNKSPTLEREKNPGSIPARSAEQLHAETDVGHKLNNNKMMNVDVPKGWGGGGGVNG